MPVTTPGAIVLAAYQPRAELFRRQLQSIAQQTVTEWTCVISSDSDPDDIRRLVEEFVPGDHRFVILDTAGERLGFYLNFERALQSIPPNARWVALADQDDEWYPDKLETLVPLLDEHVMVSGQARLVHHPSGAVLGMTTRQNASAERIALSNQFTGSLSIIRRSLLDVAMPFPRLSTRAAAHDHWLAVCAGHVGTTGVVDVVVQDYVQHDANVFGDPTAMAPPSGWRSSLANARRMSQDSTGSSGLRGMLQTTFDVYVGWRQLMADVLEVRSAPDTENALTAGFSRRRRLRSILRILRSARRTDYVPTQFRVQYLASWMCGAITGGRRRIARLSRSM
ncbi:glycosyltransferase [Microbacterium aurum]